MSDTPISNTPMSATPRTDAEYRQLEVAIYNLKTESNLLHEALDQVIEDRDAYHDENNRLRLELQTAKDEGYNQGFREGLAFKGKPTHQS